MSKHEKPKNSQILYTYTMTHLFRKQDNLYSPLNISIQSKEKCEMGEKMEKNKKINLSSIRAKYHRYFLYVHRKPPNKNTAAAGKHSQM